jgi:hypothetical protein
VPGSLGHLEDGGAQGHLEDGGAQGHLEDGGAQGHLDDGARAGEIRRTAALGRWPALGRWQGAPSRGGGAGLPPSGAGRIPGRRREAHPQRWRGAGAVVGRPARIRASGGIRDGGVVGLGAAEAGGLLAGEWSEWVSKQVEKVRSVLTG